MTAGQRAELLKCVAKDDSNRRLSFFECEKIAKDLDLTLEQVCLPTCIKYFNNFKHPALGCLVGNSRSILELIC